MVVPLNAKHVMYESNSVKHALWRNRLTGQKRVEFIERADNILNAAKEKSNFSMLSLLSIYM